MEKLDRKHTILGMVYIFIIIAALYFIGLNTEFVKSVIYGLIASVFFWIGTKIFNFFNNVG